MLGRGCYSTFGVLRGHHRKVRILFGLSDILLIGLAFWAAYWIRTRLGTAAWTPMRSEFRRTFFLTTPICVLLAGWSMLIWVLLGYWWEIYDHIDSAHPRVILRDAFRQCALGAASVVLLQFLLRLDLSRSFLALFAVSAWVLLCLYRLNAGRVVGMLRREFTAPHYIMVVGVGEARQRLGRQLEEAAPYGVRLNRLLAGGAVHAPGQ